ncbi:SUMF1/EgtB/PvdO family nonheme iron enzyme [Thiorhodococcus mannitoliphagus]|uniref:non-specific serine/threonine protein kinase n=1 Tax=Thiorhodococcus mannitoliphagus TaxID=329406 RepID=A0A6P1E1S4_9GAMM|nr:SUMF1/EgtB/PvdO family nonheme iron enzyme [Thiorhodococcus mannitoliphagus]
MKIPGYTIIRELGSGGMATVYLARQDRLTRDVALKVMKPIAMTGGDFTSRFVKEGQIIAQLQHPQIVTIYDFDSSEGYHYFSMEHLPGGTLADEIKRGMPPSRVISIAKKIAEALAVAHARGVIHRDVKPQNILFRSDGTPVLTDFGIARAVTRDPDSMQLTSYGMVIGSPRYMSPEQSTGQALDARSDLYSLGVVFYEMLTHELPYEADDVVSLAMKHCNDPIPRLPHGLEPYQSILDRLIAKKPEDRFDSAGQLIRALEELESTTTSPIAEDDATRVLPRRRQGASTEPPTQARTQQRSQPERPSRWRLFGILGLLAALGMTVAIYLIQNDDQTRRAILDQLPQAQANRPETVVQYEDLAIQHFLESKVDASLNVIRLGLAITPDDTRLIKLKSLIERDIEANKRLAEARALRRENRLDEGLSKVMEGLGIAPEHPGLLALKDTLDKEIAERRARQAAELLARARTALEADRLDEARRLVEQGLTLTPQSPDLAALRDEIADRSKKMQDLDETLRRITDLIAAKRLDAAKGAIQAALTVHPDNAKLLDLQASVQRQLDRERERDIAARIEKAKAQLANGNFSQAQRLTAEGLALYPDDQGLKALEAEIRAAQSAETERQADERLNRALKAFDEGDLDTSRTLVEEGLQIMPDHSGLLALRERIRDHQRLAEQIAKQLADCAAQFPQDQTTIASSLEAKTCYGGVLSLEPANPKALAAIHAIGDRVAELIPPLLDDYRLAEAEAGLAQLLKIDPDHEGLTALQEDLQRHRDFFPAMVEIPGGCFAMGSPDSEQGRESDERQHDACVQDFQLGRFEVSVQEFARFVKATGYRTDAERGVGDMNGCEALDRDDQSDSWKTRTWASWRKPNKYRPSADDDPVTCVSWHDADAYIKWLNEETAHAFRLPTEAEWELAARAGTAQARFWGNGAGEQACDYSNTADLKAGWEQGFPCGDGYEWVAPVGSFRPNPWGLFDTLGNVWEWTCSEYDPGYGGTELLCAPRSIDAPRVMRGGAWNSGPALIRSAYRNRNFPETRYSFVGFRLAHDMPKTAGQD